MDKFILYSYFRSSASYRARIALNLKEIEYEYRAVHLLNNGGEQHRPDYVAINPSQQVPTLVHNGKLIGQSVAIIDYLDAMIATPRLFPKDPYARSQVLQACEIVNSGIQPLMNTGVVQHLGKEFGANEETRKKWIIHFNQIGLEALEAFLKKSAGAFSFGDDVTAADCFVIPQLYGASRFETPLEAYPTLLRIRESCEKLEAFVKASPLHQPDTPDNLLPR